MTKEKEEMTGQKYCNCYIKDCPVRGSWDRDNSDLPHIVRNLQGLLACMNQFKNDMPDSDFRILMNRLIDHNKALIGTEPPHLGEEPTGKKCSKCKKWKTFYDFNHKTQSYDARMSICNKCNTNGENNR